jgi:hypothetical protein
MPPDDYQLFKIPPSTSNHMPHGLPAPRISVRPLVLLLREQLEPIGATLGEAVVMPLRVPLDEVLLLERDQPEPVLRRA